MSSDGSPTDDGVSFQLVESISRLTQLEVSEHGDAVSQTCTPTEDTDVDAGQKGVFGGESSKRRIDQPGEVKTPCGNPQVHRQYYSSFVGDDTVSIIAAGCEY